MSFYFSSLNWFFYKEKYTRFYCYNRISICVKMFLRITLALRSAWCKFFVFLLGKLIMNIKKVSISDLSYSPKKDNWLKGLEYYNLQLKLFNLEIKIQRCKFQTHLKALRVMKSLSLGRCLRAAKYLRWPIYVLTKP